MEDHSSPHSFSNLHQHRRCPPLTLSLPTFESSEAGYSPSLPAQGSLELFGSNREESTALFSPSNSLTGARRERSRSDDVFLDNSGSSVDRDSHLRGHLDRDFGPGDYFQDSWYASEEKEVWDNEKISESVADHFHDDGYGIANGFYRTSCNGEDTITRRAKAEYDGYAQTACNRDADSSCFHNKQTIRDGGFDQCWMNVRVLDRYIGKEEDYGSSCGSGEDQGPAAEVEGSWPSVSPSNQGSDRWRGEAETNTLTSACLTQTSHAGRKYTQKLDSFSEAFLSQRRRVPSNPGGDSSDQMWETGEEQGRGDTESDMSNQNGSFGSDSYVPSSSRSPAHLILPPFPSPPSSSLFMPSVLSPPPTPLPPPSLSPSKVDSPRCSTGNAASHGGEPLGMLQLFMPHLQGGPAVHPAGMVWKFPMLSHCMSAGEVRSPHGGGNITAAHNIVQSAESPFFSPPHSHCSSSVHPSRALCSPSSPTLHLHSRSPQITSQRHPGAGYTVSQKVKKSPGIVNQSHKQKRASVIYTMRPFVSVLHSGGGQTRSHYTPQPLLDPQRVGTGLYSSFSSLHQRTGGVCAEEVQCSQLPRVNVGPDFQADLPPSSEDVDGSEVWAPEGKSPCEELLWKPSDELEESANLQNEVEKLLSVCSSSCIPGGGSNTELALHCLHYCHGNTVATLEMLLLSQCSPTGDYHYSGCDFWSDTEKRVFSAAFSAYGKDFSLIQKMVKTKTVRQCVEFYYLGRKLQDKQKKQEEESREAEREQQKRATPKCQPVGRQFAPEEVAPAPPLASFFPCKLCGKMFYKIKSRNAHMKIHRQPQEDWTDRRLQHQLLTQRLTLTHPASIMPTSGTHLPHPQSSAVILPSSGLGGASSNSNSDDVHRSAPNGNLVLPTNGGGRHTSTAVSYNQFILPNSNVIHNDGSDSDHRDPVSILPLHQSWGSFGHQADMAAIYSDPKGKACVAAGTAGGNESVTWQ